MSKFGMILTKAGRAKVINAQMTQEKMNIVQFAVGDANGTPYTPVEEAVSLRNEQWRGPVAAVEIAENNPYWIVVTCQIPAQHGGFMIHEAGLYDEAGDLIAIGRTPESYKPVLAEGASKDFVMQPIIEVSNAASVTLRIDPNVIQASRDYVNTKVGKITQELKETTEKLDSNGTVAPLLATLTWDDGYIWDYTVVYPWLKSKGLVGSIALINNSLNSNPKRFMNTAHVLEMQENGWEFEAHTLDHLQLDTLTKEEQEYQMVESKKRLEALGIDVRGIVYPRNYYNADTLEIARKHYDYAFALDMKYSKRWVNYAPINQYAIYRIELEVAHATFLTRLGDAVVKGGWIVLMGHSNRYDINRTDIDAAQQWENAKTNIQYLIDNGVEIVTPSKAIEFYGNNICLGDDQLSDGNLFVGKNGAVRSKSLLNAKVIDDGSVSNATPASFFADNTYTIVTLKDSDNGEFPTAAGTLHVYNFGERLDLITQIWEPHNTNDSYRRKWIFNTKTWTNWSKVSETMWIKNSDTSITADTPANEFEINMTSIYSYLTADGGKFLGFPTDAGKLVVEKYGVNALTNQTWIPHESGQRYTRHWINPSNRWSRWSPDTWFIKSFPSVDIPELPANSAIYIELTVEGLTMSSIINATFTGNQYGEDVDLNARCNTANNLIVVIRNFGASAKPATKRDINVAFLPIS